ncbi:hypothetical protein J2125_003000 [Erwinia toletana]|uniref:Uncharacterized protein n=1 Tax=Winslowiella toletana TaxID=92490 RepID=A0ABS4PAX8_9GAMM|nr:hypothetical protein [Winslowiella toletana]MBP2169808.1 hypothetical protein [Winslowiella toletana]
MAVAAMHAEALKLSVVLPGEQQAVTVMAGMKEARYFETLVSDSWLL